MRKETKSRTQSSVENGVKIIRKAIKRNISLSEASRQSNFGKNYVSDIKARISDNYKSRRVARETYMEFKSLMKEYSSR
jgi:hypothetical protein